MADLMPPPSVMATWPTPNYVDPVVRGSGLLVANALLSSVSLIVTSLRLYTRVWITATPGLDDIFAVLAFVRETPDILRIHRLI